MTDVEDGIERIEEIIEKNEELVAMFYADYLHRHFVDIMVATVGLKKDVKCDLISLAAKVRVLFGHFY